MFVGTAPNTVTLRLVLTTLQSIYVLMDTKFGGLNAFPRGNEGADSALVHTKGGPVNVIQALKTAMTDRLCEA